MGLLSKKVAAAVTELVHAAEAIKGQYIHTQPPH